MIKQDKQPVGVLMLFDQDIEKMNDDEGGLSKPNRFVIQKPDAVALHLAADNGSAQSRWIEVIGRAISDSQTVDEFVEETTKTLLLAPSSVPKPDCFGYLVKLGTQWKSWSKRYCVLKDACLYFYQDANAKSAFGMLFFLGNFFWVYYSFFFGGFFRRCLFARVSSAAVFDWE